jgi:hypothetical protein
MSNGKILLSSARSGTNFFLTVYAKCFPQDFVVKEIFRPAGDSFAQLEELLSFGSDQVLQLVKNDPLALWQMIESKTAKEGRSALAKIFYYHVDQDNPIWAYFRDNNKIVHLIRRNAFDVFVSHKVGNQTGKSQEFGKDAQPTEVAPLVIDKEELMAFLDKQRTHIDQTRSFFANADYAEIFYEDIAVSADDCAETLCSIYGAPCPAEPISIGLRKQKSKTNEEIVANYAEVAQFDAALL